MTMITPTRFGLKYGPIPTLALEYEEDLGLVENDDGTRSLYVYKETADKTGRRVRKKLHVVELPQLTGQSEPLTVVRQLQKDNGRFLGPSIVREQQLQRLLQQLVDHLPKNVGTTSETVLSERIEPVKTEITTSATRKNGHEDDTEEQDEEQLDERVMEESVAAESTSLDESRSDSRMMSRTQEAGEVSHARTGQFVTHDESDNDDQVENDRHHHGDTTSSPRMTSNTSPLSMHEHSDAEDDEKKKKGLTNESDASDEDVQSEELEYFSEDGSDEDSF